MCWLVFIYFILITVSFLSVSSFLVHISSRSKLSPSPSLSVPPCLSLSLLRSRSSLMAPHVHLSGLACFAALCYSGPEVTPPGGLGLLRLPPYLLTLSPYICLPQRTFPACERCHMGTKIMPALLYK